MKLYHTSAYRTDTLRPSYQITGELVEWDETESNKFLYASADKAASIDQGFASLLEKLYALKRYVSNDKQITIYLYNKTIPKIEELYSKIIYLYIIDYDIGDGWVKVNNEHNNMKDEYKTSNIVPSESILNIEEINVKKWLGDKKVVFIPETAGLKKW